MKFCPTCGGAEFCQPRCTATTPRQQHHQRTVWWMGVMRDTSQSERQREYWSQQVTAVKTKFERQVGS